MDFLGGLLIVAMAVFFNRLALMERRSGAVWAAASLGVSCLAVYVLHIPILAAQFVLFCVMWFLNVMKPDQKIDV